MELKFNSAEVLAFYLSHPASITRKTDKNFTEHIAIGATENGVALIGTNDVCSFERIVPIDAVDVIKSGAITINAKRLSDIARTYGKKPISMSLDDDKKTIRIRSGRSRLIVRETGNASDYPQPSDCMDIQESLTINIKQFQRGLKMCVHTMPDNHATKVLNGIHVTIKNNTMSFVATDCHKLGVFKMPIDTSVLNAEQVSFTLPVSAVKTLQSLTIESDVARIEVSENAFALTASSLRYQTRLINHSYPDINQTIPTEIRGHAVVSKSELLSLIDRAKIANESSSTANKIIPRLDITLNGNQVIQTEVGQASDPLATDEITTVQENLSCVINTATNYLNLHKCLQTIKTDSVSMVFGVMKQRNQSVERLNILLSAYPNPENENYFSMLMPMR